MELRRNVRQTIKRGTLVYAEVIDYHLGLATVRLANGGGVLSNLSTIGGIVEVGDTVVIDYSAGTAPIVSPAFIIEAEDPGVTLAELVPPRPEAIQSEEPIIPPDPGPASDMTLDIGGGGSGYQWWSSEEEPEADQWDGTCHVGFQEWSYFPHTENTTWGEILGVIWDTSNMLNKLPNFGWKLPEPITIQQNGTYIFNATWFWYAFWHLYDYGPETGNLSPLDGFYQLAITKNAEIIGSVSTRDAEYYSQNRLAQEVTIIDDCQAGDLIQIEVWQSVLAPCYSEIVGIGWNGITDPFYYGKVGQLGWNELKAVLIPGSQGASP